MGWLQFLHFRAIPMVTRNDSLNNWLSMLVFKHKARERERERDPFHPKEWGSRDCIEGCLYLNKQWAMKIYGLYVWYGHVGLAHKDPKPIYWENSSTMIIGVAFILMLLRALYLPTKKLQKKPCRMTFLHWLQHTLVIRENCIPTI